MLSEMLVHKAITSCHPSLSTHHSNIIEQHEERFSEQSAPLIRALLHGNIESVGRSRLAPVLVLL